jgi:hypothetical protein
MAFKTFYYNYQFKKYFLQFMAIFGGMKVQVGKNERSGEEEKLVTVPIMSGNRDRVVAWIKNRQTQNLPLHLPIMSANIANVELAPDLRKGIGNVKRTTYAPRGGLVPDDLTVIRQQMPVPYRVNADLFIWASNQEQRYQMLEQIFILFDPIVQIQKTDAVFDWAKITTVELVGINYEDNYPIGTDRRLLISILNFQFPVYLSAPANLKKDFVKDIYVRIGAVEQASVTNEEIIADLDAQGIDYELWFDGDTLTLPEF